jgi:hypothetical protein
MQTNSRKQFTKLFIALFSIFIFTSMACSVGGLTLGKNSATVEVTLDQQKIDLIFNNLPDYSSMTDNQFLKKINDVKLHDGFIRIFGEGVTQDGKDVSGSVDVEVDAQNNVLIVEIIAVNIPGIDINDTRIENVNQVLAKELTEVVTETNGDVLFKKAEVAGGQLKMTVQVNYQNQE